MSDDWSDRIESLFVGGYWFGKSCAVAVFAAIVGFVAASLVGLPGWLGAVVCAPVFGVATFLLLHALDAEESRNQP